MVLIFSDIDECEDDPDICGPTSTCVNEPDGAFYSCMCAPGTTNNGESPYPIMPTDPFLTCEGILYYVPSNVACNGNVSVVQINRGKIR